MTKREWCAKGLAIAQMGRALERPLIINDDTYRFFWREWRWRRYGQKRGWI